MDWEIATFEDPWFVPLGSPLADIGRLARTISVLGASLSLSDPGEQSRLGGIRGHSLSHLSILSIHPKLLDRFWRAARGGRDLVGATLLGICNLGRGVCLGAAGGGGTNG